MKAKITYRCKECAYQTNKWVGRCPQCGEWNSFEEYVTGTTKAKASRLEQWDKKEAEPLYSVESSESHRIITGIGEFDRVMGGGIVRDSVTILTSPPGGGKSTLTLHIAQKAAKQGLKVLYASGEESSSQIKNRADRILQAIPSNIWILASTSMDDVLEAIKQLDVDLVIVDSIQTFTLKEFLPARAGNPTQTMECAGELVQCAKSAQRQRAVIMIGQMNKNDEIAGLRSLEHLVDTVLVLEGEKDGELRSMIATKNRFGSTGETGFFSMTETGLISIDNPSEYFMTKRDKADVVSGSAITVIREGSRPFVLEIESLVSNSFTPYPSRISENMKKDQMNTLISILEQRGGIPLYDKNVVIKAMGGMKTREQAGNLAVIMSIVSSVWNKPIPSDWAFIADVGLTGELKRVPSMELRIKELDRMGFDKVIVPKGSLRQLQWQHVAITEFKTLRQVIDAVFPQKG